MQNVIDKIEWMFAGLGGFLGWFFGGFDGFLYALVVFVVCDYFTGVLAAAIKHELSSEVGFKGIAKKVCMQNKKNLLIYAHYYIPDTASTGQILRELAEGMLDKFNITVICVVPSYLGTIEDKYKTQKYYEERFTPGRRLS